MEAKEIRSEKPKAEKPKAEKPANTEEDPVESYQVISSKTARVPQFPGNVNTAERHWLSFFLEMEEKGYKLATSFPQTVGVETLTMFVFTKS